MGFAKSPPPNVCGRDARYYERMREFSVECWWNATCLRICDMSTYCHCVAYGHIIPYVPLISYKTVGPKHQSVAQDSSRLPCCQAQPPPPSSVPSPPLCLAECSRPHMRDKRGNTVARKLQFRYKVAQFASRVRKEVTFVDSRSNCGDCRPNVNRPGAF